MQNKKWENASGDGSAEFSNTESRGLAGKRVEMAGTAIIKHPARDNRNDSNVRMTMRLHSVQGNRKDPGDLLTGEGRHGQNGLSSNYYMARAWDGHFNPATFLFLNSVREKKRLDMPPCGLVDD